jgi:hypothetical protein
MVNDGNVNVHLPFTISMSHQLRNRNLEVFVIDT